jgi:hypothetical protein
MATEQPGLAAGTAWRWLRGRFSTDATGDNSLSLLKSVAEVSAIAVAVAFVYGWSYLAAYYRTFGLNPIEIEVSVPVVAATAVYAFYNSKWILWTFVVFLAVIFLLGSRLRVLLLVLVSLLFILTAWAGLDRGRDRANKDILTDSSELPNVAFAAKISGKTEKMDVPSCVGFENYGSMDCKLLLHLKNTYYFFQPVPQLGVGGNINVYALFDTDLSGVHVQRGIE